VKAKRILIVKYGFELRSSNGHRSKELREHREAKSAKRSRGKEGKGARESKKV
jgi:hypothetical protein